jgi:BlaI family penicillinase repressor
LTHDVKVTDLELKILQQIWTLQSKPTVSAIREHWPESKKPGYTTILKTLQKMEEKGIVCHTKDGKQYSYFSKVSRERITDNRLGTIITRIFSGNKISFAEHFIDTNQFSTAELAELKELITRKEREEKSVAQSDRKGDKK